MGTSELIDLRAASPFEVPERNLPLAVQELQMGGTSRRSAISAIGVSLDHRSV
jgi:hypothetical protein